jgi:hypothetical protein
MTRALSRKRRPTNAIAFISSTKKKLRLAKGRVMTVLNDSAVANQFFK